MSRDSLERLTESAYQRLIKKAPELKEIDGEEVKDSIRETANKMADEVVQSITEGKEINRFQLRPVEIRGKRYWIEFEINL